MVLVAILIFVNIAIIIIVVVVSFYAALLLKIIVVAATVVIVITYIFVLVVIFCCWSGNFFPLLVWVNFVVIGLVIFVLVGLVIFVYVGMVIFVFIIVLMIILVVREAVSPLSPGADLNKTAIKGSAKGKRSICSNSCKKKTLTTIEQETYRTARIWPELLLLVFKVIVGHS